MIYGLNFNGTHIPENIRKRFASSIVVPVGSMTDHAIHGRARGILSGACDAPEEKKAMDILANNGTRRLHWISRKVSGSMVHAAYAYYPDMARRAL